MPDESQQRKAQTRGLFNTVSPDYDSGPGVFAHYGRRLVEAAEVQRDHKVLDLASGRGAVLFPAAERGAVATGLDIAEEMARQTNAEAERRGLSARVSVGDAEHLDFADATFDRVLCGFGIMFFPDQDKALREMRRVLKPGGRLAVSTWQVSQAEALSRSALKLGLGSGSAPGWITKADVLQALLERNGFTGVRVTAESQEFHYPDVQAYWKGARGTGLRGLIDNLVALQKDQLMAEFVERVKPYTRADGLHLTTTALVALADR